LRIKCSTAVGKGDHGLPDELWERLRLYAARNPDDYRAQLIWNQQRLQRLLCKILEHGCMTPQLQEEQRSLDQATRALAQDFPDSHLVWSLRANVSRFAMPWDSKETDALYARMHSLAKGHVCVMDDVAAAWPEYDTGPSADLNEVFRRTKERALDVLMKGGH